MNYLQFPGFSHHVDADKLVKTRSCKEPRLHGALCCSGWLEPMRSESQARDKISFETRCEQSNVWACQARHRHERKETHKEQLFQRSEVTLPIVLLIWRPVTGRECVSVPLQFTGCIHGHRNKLIIKGWVWSEGISFYDSFNHKYLQTTMVVPDNTSSRVSQRKLVSRSGHCQNYGI